MLEKHGATEIGLTRGTYEGRAAYQLRFLWGGMPVEIVQVSLPSRVNSNAAKAQAERQALYHLHEELRFELERRHFHPEIPAFVPYMIASTSEGDHIAVWQVIKQQAQLQIEAGAMVGEIVDDGK